MKMQIIIVSCFLGTVVSFAQGSVLFANGWPLGTTGLAHSEVNAPFFDNQGAPLTGPAYVAQLYAGETQASLAPVGAVVQFGTPGPSAASVPPGYFYYNDVDIIPFPPFSPVWVQVRAWAVTGGATYEQAAAAGAYTGLSNILSIHPGDPDGGVPSEPAHLVGLQFLGVPEPAPWLLGLLGFGVLAFRPRRRF